MTKIKALYKSSPELRQWHQNAINISWLKQAPLNRIERDQNGNAIIPL